MIRYLVYAGNVLVIMTNNYQKVLDVFKFYSICNNCNIIDKLKETVVAVSAHRNV